MEKVVLVTGGSGDIGRNICREFANSGWKVAIQYNRGEEAAKELGLPYANEVFADRAYEEDGSLVSRQKPGSMIHDEDLAIQRVLRMVKENRVQAITGKDIPIAADSICVHGDNPRAVEFVKAIRKALTEEGITVRPLREVE